MIYTVTLNPSLDYIVGVEGFKEGQLNRTSSELILPGGKGINVSIVLGNMGIDSTMLGFTAGYTGQAIKELLKNYKATEDFTNVSNGLSRINVKLRSLAKTGDGKTNVSSESEINGMGPSISAAELEEFFGGLGKLVDGDILVLSGSVPATLPSDIYHEILRRVSDRNITTIVDAGKELLIRVLELHPTLVKPNHIELGDIFGVQIESQDMAIEYARRLQQMGVKNVLVSMAGAGAVLVTDNGSAYKKEAPSGQVVNSVGAGDSMVAGYIYGLVSGDDQEKALLYGLAAGSASAFSENLATKQEILHYMDLLQN